MLSSKAVQTDDTPVPVLDPELPRTRTGRIWTYVGDQDHPYTVYDYTPTRSRDGPDAFLKPFTGYLRADAYAGYDQKRERPKVLPKSPEGQAMAYTLSNWKALVRYSEDGDLEIDNNGAERIAAHPKNRLEELLPDQWAAAPTGTNS